MILCCVQCPSEKSYKTCLLLKPLKVVKLMVISDNKLRAEREGKVEDLVSSDPTLLLHILAAISFCVFRVFKCNPPPIDDRA